jgi:hypothetical protein
MKLHGNTRIISRKNFQAYSALNYWISGRDSLKGGRSMTPHIL